MRLLSFIANTEPAFGIATDEGVIDLRHRVPSLELGEALGNLEGIERFIDESPDYSWDSISFDLPIPNQRRLLCAGLNYHKKYPLGLSLIHI